MNTENTGPEAAPDNTQTIARNALWWGADSAFNLLAVFVVSVAVARVIGKDDGGKARLGDYSFVVWLTNVSIALGSFGLPATARKYIAEYLNRGQAGIARATYLSTLKIQGYIALAVLAIAMAIVAWVGAPPLFLASTLLVLAMAPRVLSTVPSQANNAAEDMRRNTGPSVAGAATTTVLTIVCLLLTRHYGPTHPAIAANNWDLAGLAAALFIGSALECAWKLQSVEQWLGRVPRAKVAPDLVKRMFAYSGQGTALLILNIVVWDRSDLLILKWLNHDPRQIFFFSLAFNLAERILLIPGVFNGSLAATMMAQYGRARERLKEMTVDGGRYALLIALPLLVGIASIAGPLVRLVYGNSYQALVPTMAIVALMAIPKAVMQPPTLLLQAEERQVFLIVWGCLCGAVDIGLDILLVGRYGAAGAAVANGTAQTLAALGIWIYVWRTNRLDLHLPDFGRILLSGALMAAAVLAFTRLVPGYLGTLGAVVLGAAIWFLAVRLTGALRPHDASRFQALGRRLPARLAEPWKRFIDWLAPVTENS